MNSHEGMFVNFPRPRNLCLLVMRESCGPRKRRDDEGEFDGIAAHEKGTRKEEVTSR